MAIKIKGLDTSADDTISSLGAGLIKTCDSNAPTFAFFLIPAEKQSVVEEGKVAEIDLVVESYVKMSALPKDIAQTVRQALQGK